MDFKTLKKRLLKNGFSKWAFIVLAALTVLFIIFGAVKNKQGETGAVKFSDHREDEGTYAYVDVASFDEWVCTYNDETYYVLYDNDGYSYLAVVSDREMKKMERQATKADEYSYYFNQSYRMYGLVKKTSGKVMSFVEEVYSISLQEFLDYLGRCYINTTENPNTNRAWMWWTFSIFSGLFALVFGIVWLGQEIPFRRENSDYTEEELAEAASMLDETDKKQQVILGENFIINKRTGMLVRYSDILWTHLVDSYYNGAYMGRSVGIHTRKRSEYKVSKGAKDNGPELDEIMNRIIEKNPDVIVGYSKENRKLYDSMTKK